jgi:hypothetical protein
MRRNSSGSGWIAVDLDGTLAHDGQDSGPDRIGPPVPAMLERVKRWLSEGRDVRIFTARVNSGLVSSNSTERRIRQWCRQHIGRELPITCKKDFGMVELWDDRCVQVIRNTGQPLADEIAAEREKALPPVEILEPESTGETAQAQIQSVAMPVEPWQYRDLPRVSVEVFKAFVAMVGPENIRWLSLTSGPEGKCGQFFISPQGLANLRGTLAI